MSSSATAELQLGGDVSKFYADPLGFVMYAYPWRRPGLLQQHEGPDQWQRDFLIELGRQVKERSFDGMRACCADPHVRGLGPRHRQERFVRVGYSLDHVNSSAVARHSHREHL